MPAGSKLEHVNAGDLHRVPQYLLMYQLRLELPWRLPHGRTPGPKDQGPRMLLKALHQISNRSRQVAMRLWPEIPASSS
jgi:hypothetical protein